MVDTSPTPLTYPHDPRESKVLMGVVFDPFQIQYPLNPFNPHKVSWLSVKTVLAVECKFPWGLRGLGGSNGR